MSPIPSTFPFKWKSLTKTKKRIKTKKRKADTHPINMRCEWNVPNYNFFFHICSWPWRYAHLSCCIMWNHYTLPNHKIRVNKTSLQYNSAIIQTWTMIFTHFVKPLDIVAAWESYMCLYWDHVKRMVFPVNGWTKRWTTFKTR